MDFAFSEEQEMLRTAARTLLGKASPSSVVRKLMETPDAYDPELWKKTAEQGWTALGIPEQYGGFGSFLDLIVVLEETGRVLLPGPYFETMGMAVPALLEAGSEAQKKEVLGAIAEGKARATVALTEPSGRWDAEGVALTAQKSGDGWTLNGTKLFVPGAGVADYMVVAARTRGTGEDGITLFLVKGRPQGMTVKPLSTLDMTHKWYEVKFEDVKLGANALMGEPDKAWAPLRKALDWATAGLCAEMVGGAQKVLVAAELDRQPHPYSARKGLRRTGAGRPRSARRPRRPRSPVHCRGPSSQPTPPAPARPASRRRRPEPNRGAGRPRC